MPSAQLKDRSVVVVRLPQSDTPAAARSVHPAPASATVTMQIVPVANDSGEGDPISSSGSSDDDWMAAGLDAYLYAGTFFQATLGGYTPVAPDVFEISAAAEFDTYYAVPEYEPGALGFVDGPHETPTTLEAEWFDTRDTGNGTFQLVRLTIVLPPGLAPTLTPPDVDSPPLVAEINMLIAIRSGGDLFDFH
ncbi:MAG: hypothetical protein ACYSVY_17705, partial [Planctomycetota bacterium]